jgi:hypothetical protein
MLFVAVAAEAQTAPVKNPRAVLFDSPDHNLPELTGYEVDILSPAGAVVQTISVAKAATTLVGTDVRVDINVQPVTFGTYTVVVRAVASGGVKSPNSLPSDAWERSPGPPGKPRVQ